VICHNHMLPTDWCAEPSWTRTITDNLYAIFVATTVFLTGTTLGVIATAMIVHDTREPEDTDTEIAYENRYYDLYFDEPMEPLTDERMKGLKGVWVEETTPQGVIRMEWDDDTNTFIWYATSGAPHGTLEAVARKFVCDNKCACLYHNIHDAHFEENERYDAELKAFREASTAKTATTQVSPTSSAEDFVVVKDGKVSPEPPKSVFATFKNYSTKPAMKHGAEDAELTLIREKHEKNMARIKTQMNRYRRGGTLVDHDELEAKRRAPPPAPLSGISFGMFKRMRADNARSGDGCGTCDVA
jgi:hypothetical protein